jgi:pyruvate dehydrogenase E1 component
MFGFQRIGDLVLAASDMRARGFMLGGTAGRTTLNGEGLQHEDGQSHLLASVVPTLVAYDPAFAYELAIIIQDGIHRMYAKGEDAIFYITLYNEKYRMPALPESAREGILKGLYKLRPANQARSATKLTKIHLFGSGPILLQVMRAQELLGQKFGLAADVWSATSYRELRREALDVERWNMLHPTAAPRVSFVEEVLQKEKGIFLAATDYMRQVPEMISRWVPGGLHVLGTDGFGRSDSRGALRRFFEVDAESIALAALYQLGKRGEMNPEKVEEAIKELGIDPGKPNPLRA